MRWSLVALLAVVALVVTTDGPAATHASLLPASFAPLTITGRGFAPRERVVVTLYGGRHQALRVVAGAAGGFTARFTLSQPRCSAWLVRAVGSRSGRVMYRAPVTRCKPPAAAGAAPPSTGTGIAGIVRRGPLTPVCTAGSPCDGPAAGVAVDILQGDAVIARVTTGADGRYYVLAAAGDYVVRATGRGLAPLAARVQTGRFVEVDFLIDTGIR